MSLLTLEHADEMKQVPAPTCTGFSRVRRVGLQKNTEDEFRCLLYSGVRSVSVPLVQTVALWSTLDSDIRGGSALGGLSFLLFAAGV